MIEILIFHSIYIIQSRDDSRQENIEGGGRLVWDKGDRRAGKCLSIFVSASDSYTKLLRADWDCHLSLADRTPSSEQSTTLGC